MLLIIVILLLGLIGMSLPAQNPDLYDVIVCAHKVSDTITQVTWHTPPELAQAECEISGRPKGQDAQGTTAGALLIQTNLPSNGSHNIVDVTVMYIVQVTCVPEGGGQDWQSEELTFLPGDLTNKSMCTQTRHQTNTNKDVFLCAWKAESNSVLNIIYHTTMVVAYKAEYNYM
ncbi:uncharacterized protein [Amphiura filiformis]|uniref:uncharacterized protein n=1 Tax=Amphiura filiformis TaxID=82378 RepID=UPI003B2190D5